MKAKTKLTKLWTILLSLVMLLSLLPTTALAATYAEVKVNGVSLGDGEYLTSNAATAASSSSTKPTTYVAWYKDGVLTLKNFTGKLNSSIVVQGAVAGDLTIKLIGDNTITPYDTGIQGIGSGGSITITADSGSNGKLTINMPNSERSAFGINGYASSVTIKGSADVTIIATATATNQESYGIKSNKAVSILDSASVSITCKTPNSSSRSDSCNGIYSDTGVTINTDGTIQIDVHEAGDEAYSYGINSMGTLTLTKVGEMTVKWKGKVYGAPLLPSSASFASDAYDTNVDEDACIATYKPKGTTSTTYTVSFDANGGTGTMANVTGVTGEYTLPANGFTAPSGKQFKAWSVGGSEKAVGDKITVTANTTVTAVWEDIPVVTYTVSFDANGGTGTMTDVTGVSGEYTLPANSFTAPDGKQFKAWSVGGVEKAAGDKITVTANTTVTAVWEAIEYNVTVTGGTASVGTGTPITKATMGTTVTLTAGAAPTGKVFDKWEVVSGGITLADANSATTTFTMPASAVSVKATYKNAPHTHTYNQETVKPEALKTPADCTHNAVYFKSCSCGAISTTDTFVAMNTALGHAYGSDWKYDSTNHWHECSRCHDKNDEAAHSASEWIIDTAATETAEGAKHKECTVCKKVLETATIPATGSSHTNSYGVYVGMTYTAGNLIYQITSIDTATVGQSKVIGVVAAKKNKITKVTIPDRADCKGYRLNVTAVGDNAFAGCKALKKLTIGNKVTVIGKNAFKKCSKLETVVIGKAVKTISSKAFLEDNKIKKITFKGKKLKTVNKNAFSKKAKKNIKSKKTKLNGNKKAIKLFKKKLKIK